MLLVGQVDDQGTTYAAFVDKALAAEVERRTSLDTRALNVLTTSSGLVTLLLALVVLITGQPYEVSNRGARGVAISFVFFLASATFGLVANKLWSYEVANAATLKRLLSDRWKDDEVDARNVCAAINVGTITTLRAGSNKKASLIELAFFCQLLAIASLVVTLSYEAA